MRVCYRTIIDPGTDGDRRIENTYIDPVTGNDVNSSVLYIDPVTGNDIKSDDYEDQPEVNDGRSARRHDGPGQG
jgi:hypothetical protein